MELHFGYYDEHFFTHGPWSIISNIKSLNSIFVQQFNGYILIDHWLAVDLIMFEISMTTIGYIQTICISIVHFNETNFSLVI